MSSGQLFPFKGPTFSQTTFNSTLLGSVFPVSLTIQASFEARCDFTPFLGTLYSFMVSFWSGRGFGRCAKLFFNHTSRDAASFGVMQEVRL